MSIIDGLRYWALKYNAPQASIDMILLLFKKAKVRVPASAKTLLNTKRNTSSEITEIGGGQFWYHGIKKNIMNQFRSRKCPTRQLSLTFSIDGLPLHSSSSMQFWPILFSIFELPKSPIMTAAIFCGLKKPENIEEYLRPMVEELNSLTQRGIVIQGEHTSVKIRGIVADTPARAFIKGVTGHTGYDGCLKCTVHGKYNRTTRTITFPGLNAPKRTDAGFRAGAYPGHCKTATPLLDLSGFNIIEDVIVADRLHLTDLGVMKRLLLGWRDGTLGWQRPLSTISTYPFENELQHLKRLIRSGWMNLAQAINRLSELNEFQTILAPAQPKYPSANQRGTTVTLHVRQNFMLQNDQRNCWFLTNDESIVQFRSVATGLEDNTSNFLIRGRKLNIKGLAFDYPFESSDMYIFRGAINTLSATALEIRLDQIKCKLVAALSNRDEEIVFVPLLHTLI
uniref:Transposase domain-containing protein n=1 Tax=Anopheles dirus TaxID=7168 RepID=A0A182MZG8_9DIPT